jgi:DNA-binding GntR family transcriptional regulator
MSTRITLSDKIRAAIEAEIASGQLSAGSRIDEQMLMERFDVSRTPAREALRGLMSAGTVVSVPRQGAVVASISLAECVAILEILMPLEGLAARLSARRMPAALCQRLVQADAACHQAAAQGDAVAYASANRDFHETIYDGSLNEVLAQQLRSMRLRIRHQQRALFDRPGRIRHSLAEHQRVLQAILEGDEDSAYLAMTEHLSSGGNVFADTVASIPVTVSASPAAAASTINSTTAAAVASKGKATATTQRVAGKRRSTAKA